MGATQRSCAQESHRVPLGIKSTQSRNKILLWYSNESTQLWALGSLKDVYLQNDFTSLFSATFSLGSNKCPTVWTKRGPCEVDTAVLGWVPASEKGRQSLLSMISAFLSFQLVYAGPFTTFSHLSRKVLQWISFQMKLHCIFEPH